MRFTFSLLLLLFGVSIARSDIPDGVCGRSVSSGSWIKCSEERYSAIVGESKPVTPYKIEKAIMGSCGEPLPPEKSYSAVLGGVSCGSLSVQKTFLRLPLELTKEVRSAWKMAEGMHDRAKMQEVRKQEQKLIAETEIPMYESWTWTQRVGGFDARRFGSEEYDTTCSVDRVRYTSRYEEQIDYNNCVTRSNECTETATDYNNCLEWEREAPTPDPTPIPIPVPVPTSPNYGGNTGNNRNKGYTGGNSYDRGSDTPRRPDTGGYTKSAPTPPPSRPAPAPSRPAPPPPSYGDRTSAAGGTSKSMNDSYQRSKPSNGGASSRGGSRSSGSSGGSRGGSGRRSGRHVIKPAHMNTNTQDHEIDDQSYLIKVGDRNPARSCLKYGRKCVARNKCAAYGTKPVLVWDTYRLDPYTYACKKTRAKWGEWDEVRHETRDCRNQPISVAVNFETSKDWKPGFKTSGAPHRDYSDSLPNQWDLLPGESEKVTMSLNASAGQQVIPKVSICSRFDNSKTACKESGWNDYQVGTPTPFVCKYVPKIEINIPILTLGRVVRKAPNPLKITKEGSNGSSLVFDDQRSRPSKVILEDTSRTTMLDAAEASRTFGTNEDKEAKGASASGGYWLETRFRMRLLRVFPNGKTERTTIKNVFGSNQGDIFGKTMTISLEGQDGLDRLYRPGGPAEFLFDGLYKHFGVELTPGAPYILKVSVVPRGMPWYITGCHDGKILCEGEDGTTNSYSDELDVPFIANPKAKDNSWFKSFIEWQKGSSRW